MSTKTPGLQQRSQYHAYWGRFADASALPNASGAALSDPEFSKLEAGDVAFTDDAVLLYLCVSPGTVGGGDALWRPFRGGDRFYVEDDTTFSTGQTTPQVALSLTATLDGGTYQIEAYGEIAVSQSLDDTQALLRVDGVDEANVIYDNTIVAQFQYHFAPTVDVVLSAGSHTIALLISRVGGLGGNANIRRRRLRIEKVGP